MSDESKGMAYEAGRAAMSEPPERRTVDACPFAEGTKEREAWLDGFSHALDEVPSVSDLKAELEAARVKGSSS